MKTMTLTIKGTRPMLLHSESTSDPTNEYAIRLASLTSQKNKKTEDAQAEIARVEWEAGLYFDERGVYMPTWNIVRSIQEGAQLSKKGKDIERFVQAVEERAYFPLPAADLDALWADPQYRDRRSVGVSGRRVIRTRPRIPTGWRLTLTLAYVPEKIDEAQIRDYAASAGAYIGLGDFRKRFGRYEVVG